MYKKMLVLLDGSNLAEVVFSYAQELSGRLNIDLELLHVCTPQEAEQLPMRKAYMEHRAEELREKAEKIRAELKEPAENRNISAKGTVVVGYPAEEILKYVDENAIDLVMLATHGRSGVREWDLGSVAHKVIHATKVPIWLVPVRLRPEILKDQVPSRPIVIPLDGSPLSEKVIPHAVNIAKQRGAESEVVLVYVDNQSIEPINMGQLKEREAKRAAMQKYLDDKASSISELGVKARSEILLGDPASSIIDYVRHNPNQLIAMATHGHAGISRMIFGSVTEQVLHLVKGTPIFLVRPTQ
jgi:nucleotide-binding universal stress UspA family protein